MAPPETVGYDRAVRDAIKEAAKSAAYRALGVRQRLPGHRAVLLSFDDGPEPGLTEAILDRLCRHKARAVFFNIGYQIEKAPHLPAVVRREGHVIGNHSFAHRPEPPTAVAPVVADLRRCQSLIASCTGTEPTLYRPPLGTVRWANLRAARALSLSTLLWSVDSKDWQITSRDEAQRCGDRLASTVRPGDIVLLHEHNEHVLTILDTLLPALAGRSVDLSSGLELL